MDLGDVLGTPGVRVRDSVQRASGAFDVKVRQVGPASTLNLMAQRRIVEPARARAEIPSDDQAIAASVLPPGPATEGADRRKVHVLESATGSHVVVQQRVRGCDVVGGRFVVHYDGAGAYGVTGHPVGDLADRDPGPPPGRSAARTARDAIRQQFAIEKGARLRLRPVLMPVQGAGLWAWFAKVPLADPIADIRVFLDAGTLSPLLVYPASVPALFGEAFAFAGNPMRSPAPGRVCLRDLGPDPTDSLCGARVKVVPDGGKAWTRAGRSFLFDPANRAFDEAAAYHHVSEALRYFAGLVRPELFDAPMFKPLQVVVHHAASANNAFFHPDRGMLTFGDFPPDRSAARSADMVLHEVGHAVTHAICRLSDTPAPQALALSEGYSDYFSCSALDDPRFGDYVMWRRDGARNCAKAGIHLAGDLDGVPKYVLGEAWANVLWALRTTVGASVADAVVAESLYFAPTTVSVAEAGAALTAADAALFPAGRGGKGRHGEVIGRALSERFH
ncbi:MAG: hypothetical protein ACRDZ9_01680 [Acidimicrobiales bacterium]